MLEVALIKLCRPQMEQDAALRTGTRAETGKAAGIGRGGKTAGHGGGYTPEGTF